MLTDQAPNRTVAWSAFFEFDRTESAPDVTGEADQLRETLTRFGQEVHDGLGQQLTGVRILSERLAARLAGEDHPAADLAAMLCRMAGEAHKDADRLQALLVPEPDLSRGLPRALADLAKEARACVEGEVTFVSDGTSFAADAAAARELFRIAQEAVHNAIRHGKARQVVLALVTDEVGPVLRVSDDGAGFETGVHGKSGRGLQGMRRRAARIGSVLNVRSSAGQGTTVECRPVVVRALGVPRTRRLVD